MSDVRSELLTKSPWKLMVKLSLPAILGQLVVGLYALVDSIFVGQMVGVEAMSAVSVASPFVLFNNGVAVLIGMGSGSVLSRAIGAKDQKTVDSIMGNLIAMVLLLSSLVMAVCIPLAPNLLRLSGAEGAVLDMAVNYLRIIYIGSFFVNFMQSSNMVLRAEGRMGVAMGIMASGALLNIALDPLFIHLMRGRGVEGVAVATIISQFVQATITLVYFLKKSPVIHIKRVRLVPSLLPKILSVGVSGMLMHILFLVQSTVVYNAAASLGGTPQIALMGAAQRVSKMPFADGLFDVVTAFETVYFWPDFANDLREVRRVMKSGGTFLICNEVTAPNGATAPEADGFVKMLDMEVHSSDEYRHLLSQAGFRDVCIVQPKDARHLVVVARR